jgi:hypothetical protein
MIKALAHSTFVDVRRRQILIVGLFDALDKAGLRPVSARQLHTLWYLSNALAPVWRLQPFDAALLKTDREPYFPNIQSDLDRLVGMGMLVVTQLIPSTDQTRLQGLFALNRNFADPVLATMREIEEESNILQFLGEVVQASNRLTQAEQKFALSKDATYGDVRVDAGNVIDLGEWLAHDRSTPTAEVMEVIHRVSGRKMLPAELMEIYVDHLGRRLRNG